MTRLHFGKDRRQGRSRINGGDPRQRGGETVYAVNALAGGHFQSTAEVDCSFPDGPVPSRKSETLFFSQTPEEPNVVCYPNVNL